MDSRALGLARGAAVTIRETEPHYRRSTGCEHPGMLQAHFEEKDGALDEMQEG